MKYEPGESLENWSNRVKMYEQGYALQRIAKGENVEEVMTDMARRIVDKIMHPIVGAIKESAIKEEIKRQPTEVTGNVPTEVADHVVDDL